MPSPLDAHAREIAKSAMAAVMRKFSKGGPPIDKQSAFFFKEVLKQIARIRGYLTAAGETEGAKAAQKAVMLVREESGVPIKQWLTKIRAAKFPSQN